MTDSGRIDAAVNPVVAGDGEGVAFAVGVGGGGVGVASGGVGGLTLRRGFVWLLQPESRALERHNVAAPMAARLIPMPIERWVVRLGSALANSVSSQV